jgi:hypothetical protein
MASANGNSGYLNKRSLVGVGNENYMMPRHQATVTLDASALKNERNASPFVH